MANAFFKKSFEGFLSAAINLTSHNIKVAAVDTAAYTPDFDTHQYLSSVPSGDIIGRSANLANKTVSLGVFNADDATFSSFSGDQFEALIVFRDTGSDATSPMILYIDSSYSNLPFDPEGTALIVQWPAAGIFNLGS